MWDAFLAVHSPAQRIPSRILFRYLDGSIEIDREIEILGRLVLCKQALNRRRKIWDVVKNFLANRLAKKGLFRSWEMMNNRLIRSNNAQ